MLSEKGAIIISGGSRGLGLAMARFCIGKGWPVAAFARSATPEMQALTEEAEDLFLFEAVDACTRHAVQAFVDQAASRFGRIHGLVNNAAVGQDHLLSHISPEKVDSILEIDLKAPIFLTRSVVKKMLLTSGPGHVVSVSSICGRTGYPGLTVYSAAKGGLDAFTRSLAKEVGERGILVNAIAPGFFSSEMSDVLTQEQMETIVRRTPTGRLTTADDLLPVLDFLLFKNTNMTGQVLYVDGGVTA